MNSNPQGQYYLPKVVRNEFGPKLELLADAKAGVIFPVGTSAQAVLESLEVIQKDLEHRVRLEKEEKEQERNEPEH